MTHPAGSLSLWLDGIADTLTPRPPLGGDVDVDVAIVGGGFTGLWTAYHLLGHDPALRVAIIEREICGYGASGRNGGWCVGELAASVATYARHSGHGRARHLLDAIFATVDAVGTVIADEGIDCGWARGGTIRWARSEPQRQRQVDEIAELRELGVGEDVMRLLEPDEARAVGNATEVRSGLYFAPSAALDPARLVRGLAAAVERRGATIHEQTAATSIEAGRVVTAHGSVRADAVLRATEAYTRDLPGERRTLLPLYSLMVATEPLDDATWAEIGLHDRPTFADDRYMVIYGQRTEDGRIAFGGRGAPYLFGSRIDPATERDPRAHELITATLRDLFPVLGDVEITHEWGGVLGAPRNWTPAVRYDPATGLGTAGGYVGEGVAASHLAGRTLAALVTGADDEAADLAWVGVPWRRWEPEPLRWAGVRTSRALMRWADQREFRTGRPSRTAMTISRLLR